MTLPEGRALPLVVHTSALHDHKGAVSGAIAVLNDHSRLKALEEDKRRTDRLSALGAMATGIAHEIRNPLVAIKTFAELLPERADDHEFRSTFAKVAVKEIHRIEQLLGRLRALAVPSVLPARARSTSRCRWPRRSTSSAARPIAGGSAPWSRSSTTCRRSWASSTS